MAVTVKFFIFAHGNVVRGEEGASYDRDPLRKIRLKTDATYTDLLNAICNGVGIGTTTHQIKVHHRHPNKSVEGRVHYSLVPILDDDDVKDLSEMAQNTGEGSIQELYLEISDRSIALCEHETQQVVVTKPSTSEMPRSKRDPMTEIEDFTPKRARYEMHLSKDINIMEQEINCVLEDPIIETSKNLIVADLRNEDPSENLMIHKLHDPTAFPMPPSSISMDIANEMEDGSKSSRASSSTTPPHGKDYEVFLSFRGEDTRCGFTDHLYNGLVNAGVLAFRDDNELRVGEEIGPDLLKAIKCSRISIIIISENYASSAWCLEELVQILECRKTSRQVVLPILYKVEPSEVRNQKGNFGEGFLKSKKRHYGKESLIQKWKNALGEVTSLKVWESSKIANGHEGELSKMVVHEVLQVLNKVTLPVCNHLVGVEHHVEKIIKWTSNSKQSCNAQAILIHGMGGIGKTTLAKAVYDQLRNNFERCSFIANIRATSQQKGLEGLQKQLILNVIGQKLHIENIDKGSDIIKARCNGKKVLMLLDDIDDRNQLNALAREPDWFGAGTVIIITSRRKDVLGMWEDSFSYELEKLTPDQSFMLFCKHAFKKSDSITDEYNFIAKEIVSTTDGLPLAIKVIGSLLKGKGKSFWIGNLEILKEIPHHKVQKKLKISFDALEQEEKEIFLDIACLEINDKQVRESAFYMWDNCGFYPHVRIENLISLSLIKMEENGELIIHDQLRDLGRQIIRQESLHDPGQRSRIWKEKDALNVLESEKGTGKIETLNLWRWWRSKPVPCTSKQFKRMKKLRYLSMQMVNLEGDFKNLFQNLRCLNWWRGELDFKGSNFIPKQLVVLELFDVNIVEEWMGWSQIKHLRVLRLLCCYKLITLPDLSALKELEVLILRSCCELIKIHPSIGKLKRLTKLDLQGTKITQLPDSISDLCNLELLDLSSTKVTQLPDSIGDLCNLELLDLSSTKVTQLPDSVGDLRNLKELHLSSTPIRCLPTSILKLSKLQKLDLWDCRQLKWLPNLPTLTSLKFCGDLIETLPDFSSLTNLEHLQFTALQVGRNSVRFDCSDPVGYYDEEFEIVQSESGNINLLRELPSTLVNLIIKDYYTLQTLPNFSDLKNLTALSIKNCPELIKIDGLDGAESLTCVKIGKCKKLSKLGGMGISVTRLKLKDLDSLASLPNLSPAKKLKNLTIRNCKKLIEVQGLDNMESIESLVINGCSSLERIGDLSNLKMLTMLELCDCEKLSETLPDFSNLTNLTHLEFTHDFRRQNTTLNFRNLNQIPTLWLDSYIVMFVCFDPYDSYVGERYWDDEELEIAQSESENIDLLLELPSTLVNLILKDCYTLRTLPNFSDLKNLTDLSIENCPKLMKIDGLDGAESLTSVMIGSCKKLSTLNGMGISVTHLELEDLDSLVNLPNLSPAKKLKDLRIRNCKKLIEVQGLDNMEGIESLVINGCSSLERIGDLSNLKMLTMLELCDCEKLSETLPDFSNLINLTHL